MRNILSRLTTIRADYADTAEQQQAHRLLVINLAWIGLLVLATPLALGWTIDAHQIDAATLFIPASVGLAVLTYQSIQHGYYSQARVIFVLNVVIAALLATFPNYRLDSPFIITLTLPITAAGVLLPRPGLFVLAVIVIAAITIGGIIQVSNDMAPTPLGTINESIRTTIVLAAAIILLNTVMLWTFLSSIDDAIQQQRHFETLLKDVSRISETLVGLPADEDQLNLSVEQIRDALGLYHVQVFLTDSSSGLAVLRASTGFMGRRMFEENSLLTPEENSPINNALRQKDPIVITDSAPEHQRAGFLPATHSELLVPLRVGNLLPIGVLDLHSTSRDAFSDEFYHAVATLGNQMAAALHTMHQARELRAGYEERDRLSGQLDTARRELGRTNRQLVSATWGTYLEERQEMIQGFDWQGGDILSARTQSAVLDKTVSTGEAYLDYQDDTAMLSVPIRLRGQTLGAVEFRRSGDARWSPSALEMAQAVAERLALSLENARLFEQTQNAAQREQLVSRVTSQLQTTNNLQALLTLAAAQFQEALGATRTQVRLGLPTDSAGHPAQE